MDQIGIKLPEPEIKFLEWYSKNTYLQKLGFIEMQH